MQCHIIGHIDTDPFKPALSPPTHKKKGVCSYLYDSKTILNYLLMRTWEPGFLWLQSAIPSSPSQTLSGVGLLSPGSPLGTHSAGPARSHVAAAALDFSTAQSLQRFWELKHPTIIPSCRSRVGLSSLCKSFTVYKRCFHWPRSCSSRVGAQGERLQTSLRLHSAHICSQGPPDMCVYKKDCITQVIIILLQRRAWIYCSGVSHFSYWPWKMFLQTKLQNTELLAKVCVIYHLIKM